MSEEYDIAGIYAEMEKEIMSSMQRNLSRHIEEEKRIGFDYPQWQAEKLRSLRRYQIENAKIIHSYTEGLPLKVKAILQDELKQGTLKELKKYKDALAVGYKSSVVMKDSFFKINARKVNSLIKSIDNDLTKANQACLRYVNDAYRQVIFKSEMFVANGVYTEQKAVDKAIEEFVKRGLHCIEYANGAYHDIADYADMAVKTASQRAQLMGEGEFRKKIGNSLIKITKHGGTCPLCAKWEGRVLIDDVYSGGTRADGNYPLLSEAMAAGLYHPRCRHGTGTYYPEVDDIWNDKEENIVQLQEKQLHNKNKNDRIKTVNKDVKTSKSEIHNSKPMKTSNYRKGVSDFDEAVQGKIRRDEAIISGNNYETGIIYDQSGKRILTKKGTRNEVTFSKKEQALLKDSIITHNHPNGDVFSPKDLQTFRNHRACEVRAVTRNKCYSIKAPQQWTKEALEYDIDTKIGEYELEIANKYRDIAAQNDEPYGKYLSSVFEEAVGRVAEDMGAKFTIEVRQ